MAILWLLVIPLILCLFLVWFQSYCLQSTRTSNKPNRLWRLIQILFGLLPIGNWISLLVHIVILLIRLADDDWELNKENKFVKAFILK